MLIVIVIIWILAAYLIPRISGAQWKARDVARKADVNQIVTAIFEAKMDGKIADNSEMEWTCLTGIKDDLVPDYISSVEKDPAGNQVITGCDYYAYIIKNWSIAVMAQLEWEGGNSTWNLAHNKTNSIDKIREAMKNSTWKYYVQLY